MRTRLLPLLLLLLRQLSPARPQPQPQPYAEFLMPDERQTFHCAWGISVKPLIVGVPAGGHVDIHMDSEKIFPNYPWDTPHLQTYGFMLDFVQPMRQKDISVHHEFTVLSLFIYDGNNQLIARAERHFENVVHDYCDDDCVSRPGLCDGPASIHGTRLSVGRRRKHQGVSLTDGADAYLRMESLPLFRHGVASFTVNSGSAVSGRPDFNNFLFLQDDEFVTLDEYGSGCLYSTYYEVGSAKHAIRGEEFRSWDVKIVVDGALVFQAPLMSWGSGKTPPFIYPLNSWGVPFSGYHSDVPIVFHRSLRMSLVRKKKSTLQERIELFDEIRACIRQNTRCPFTAVFQHSLHKYDRPPVSRPFNGGMTTELATALSLLWDEKPNQDNAQIRTVRWSEKYPARPYSTRALEPLVPVHINSKVHPQQSLTVLDLQNTGGVIVGFSVELEEGEWETLELTITFDDEPAPQVQLPLPSFFGKLSREVTHQIKSYLISFYGQRGFCYFPMPFWRSVRIVITNVGPQRAALSAMVEWSRSVLPEDEAGHFFVQYKPNSENTLGKDVPFVLSPPGRRGHYLGHFFHVSYPPGFGNSPMEGDFRIWTDSTGTPQYTSTGVEDLYYNAHVMAYTRNFSLPNRGNPYSVFTDHYALLQQSGSASQSRFGEAEARHSSGFSKKHKHFGLKNVLLYVFHLANPIVFQEQIVGLLELGDEPIVEKQGKGMTNYMLANTSFTSYMYLGRKAGWAMSDRLDVGDANSRSAHGYSLHRADLSILGKGLESQYAGHMESPELTFAAVGGLHGLGQTLTFFVAINPQHRGVSIRRNGDASFPHQRVAVRVNGVHAGTWTGGSFNDEMRWQDTSFLIPSAVLQRFPGVAQLSIELETMPFAEPDSYPPQKVVPDSALAGQRIAWTDYTYWIHSFQ
jgi:hypothetical protein